MRTLITGIDGFVGRYLATELTTHGYEVIGTTVGPDEANVFHIELTDLNSVMNVLARVQPEIIFHLAGFTSVKESWAQPEVAMRINCDGTRNLFSALSTLSLSPRVLISGTAEVYGIPKTLPITETHPVAPINPYAKSKWAQEQVTREYPNVPSIIARSFPHIGPGQTLHFVAADFARQIVAIERGQATTITVGNLEAIRDYTDVRDVVRAYRLLIERGVPGEIYNVCSGRGFRISELLDHLQSLSTKTKINITLDPSKLRPSDIPSLIGKNDKLRAATDWSPMLNIQDTLGEILAMYRQQV